MEGGKNEVCNISHITLLSLETFDKNAIEYIKRVVGKISSKQKQFSVSFASVGSFMNDMNVVFLNPTMTTKLKILQNKIEKKLSKFSHKDIYCYDRWTPHSTIAINLSDDEFLNTFKLLKENISLPLQAKVCYLMITQYEEMPGKQIAVFDLKN